MEDSTAFANPSGWPAEVTDVFQRAITCEFASLTARGAPLTFPLTPYIGLDGRTLDVSTGLTYSAKAERARRNPKVSLLYSDPTGSGLTRPPTVLVYGQATVRDRDLQANTDRYVRECAVKLPGTVEGIPRFLLRQMGWYYVRIYILVTPLKIVWWPESDLDAPPQIWRAPAGIQAPPSDPPPSGPGPGSWATPPPEWRPGAEYALARMGMPVLTTVDPEGYPVPLRMKAVRLEDSGFHLVSGATLPHKPGGSACLTFHRHDDRFIGQENMVFAGEISPRDDGWFFSVHRRIGDWSAPGPKLQVAIGFIWQGFKLGPRLKVEASRRGQPVPVVNFP